MPISQTLFAEQRPEPKRSESVQAPKDHAGVGKALRSAYLPRVSDMPDDMAMLLDRLS